MTINELAAAALPGGPAELDLAAILWPDWRAKERWWGWHDHVPRELKEAWGRLGEEARLAAYLVAQAAAKHADALMDLDE